ncbi:MAG: HlyD family secretion protein [Bacteroidales bacterium]
MTKITFLFFSFLISLLVGSCGKKDSSFKTDEQDSLFVRGVGKVIPEDEILQLSLDQEGVVDFIYVAENDTVFVGEPVLQLSNQQQENQILIAEAQIITQQKRIESQKAILEEEKTRMANKRLEYERILRLYQENAETGQVKDDMAAEVKIQEAVIVSVQKQLEGEIKRLEELGRMKEQDQTQLSKRTLYSPHDGLILELPVKKGEYLKGGSTAAQLQPFGKIVVLCEIDELFAPQIKEGQRAFLISSASLDTIGSGEVVFASKYLKKKSLFYEQAGESEDRRVMEIKILPDSILPVLLNSKIECSVKTDHVL